MSRGILPFLTLLAACGEDLVRVDETPDGTLVARALDAARPEPLLDFVDALLAWEPGDCPAVVVTGEGDERRETWTGDCVDVDGTLVEGSLELYEGDGLAWVAGDGFRLQGDDFEAALDGAVEVRQDGELLMVDAAATWCGDARPCDLGARTVDVTATVYPASGLGRAYDATVTGAVGVDEQLVGVDGAWSVDAESCGAEPASGTLAIGGSVRHGLAFDGAESCDACADWIVQGVEAGRLCGLGG